MNTYTKLNIIPASTVMNTTINSLAMQLENMFGFAIQIVFTGTPTGSFKLQASCDPVPNPSLTVGSNGVVTYVPSHWSDVSGSSISVAAAGDVFWNYANNVNWTYVRVQYTDNSGGASTATITSAVFNGKGA